MNVLIIKNPSAVTVCCVLAKKIFHAKKHPSVWSITPDDNTLGQNNAMQFSFDTYLHCALKIQKLLHGQVTMKNHFKK